MIQYRIKQLKADKEAREKRRITMEEIAEETGISRATLYRMTNPKDDFSTKTRYIEKLCIFFQCSPGELIEIVALPVYKKSIKNQNIQNIEQ